MSTKTNEPDRINVLGTGISNIDMAAALRRIDTWISTGNSNYVCVTGMHGVMVSLESESLRTIHNNAGMVTPDGKSVVWYSYLKGFRNIRQVCGPELFPKLCEHSLEKGYKHFFYGGAENVPALLKRRMQERFPGLDVVGTYSPPFRPLSEEEDRKIVDMINASGADIIWVGLSTPKQERWMSEHIDRLNNSVLIGVGAAFDIHAGLKSRAPRWMSTIGMEWSYRMCQEPKRLARRFLVYIPRFVVYALLELSGLYKSKDLR